MRKYREIDVVKLYAQADTEKWNQFLTGCLERNDVESLKKTYYGIQTGVDKAHKDKVTTDSLNVFFIRLQRSLEITLKRVYRKKHPNPYDNPLFKTTGDSVKDKLLKAKKTIRDQELESIFKRIRF